MRTLSFFILLLSAQLLFSQNIRSDQFDKSIFFSDFSSAKDSRTWLSANNADELILIVNGTYEIDRRNPAFDRVLFPDYLSPFQNYELTVNFTLETLITNEQFIGICFSFSYNYDQGYIIEFNRKKQFRIKKINKDGTISYIGGKTPNKSWIKNNLIVMREGTTDVNIRAMGKRHEVYINNFFAFAFDAEQYYEFRNFGLFVTKATKGIFHSVHLAVNQEDIANYSELLQRIEDGSYQSDDIVPQDVTVVKDEEIIIDESKSVELVVNLNNQIKKLEKNLEDNKLLLERCKDDNIKLNDYIKKNVDANLEKRLVDIEKENNLIKDELAKLRTDNRSLIEFRNYFQQENKNKDIVNFLYDELKKLEEKNAFLNRQVEQLQEQLKKQKK